MTVNNLVYNLNQTCFRPLILFYFVACLCCFNAKANDETSSNKAKVPSNELKVNQLPVFDKEILSDIGFPLIQSYSAADYSAHAQNWAIAQATNGLLYFGNNEGVLEYDGVNWRLIPVSNGTVVRSLTVDPISDRIYLGVIGDFGYLESDSSGNLQYFSLKEKLPIGDRDFADVWNTFYTKEGIFFFTQNKLFLVKNNNVIQWGSETSFHRAFQIGERIFIRERKKGLLELIDGKLQQVNGGEEFADDGINFIVPWPSAGEGGLLLGSLKRGLVLYDGIEFRNWQINFQKRLKNMYTGVRLNDGRLVIGTLNSGVMIISESGTLVIQIDQELGLPDNVIYALKTDYEGGLWVATDRGIARLETATPLSHFDERLGLKGQVLKTIFFNNTLFVGTSNGLYRLSRKYKTQFEKIEGINNLTFDLLVHNDRLVIANHQGLFQLKESKVSRLIEGARETAFALTQRVNSDNQIIIGDRLGVAVLELKNNKWKEHRLTSIKHEVRGLLMDSSTVLWVNTNSNGIMRVTLPLSWPQGGPPTVETFDQSNGLPLLSGNALLKLNNQMRFATEKGVTFFNEQSNQFEVDPFFKELSTENKLQISRVEELKGIGFWALATKDESGERVSLSGIMTVEADQLKWESASLSALSGLEIESIFYDQNSTLWLGSVEGLFRYRHNPNSNYSQPFNILLRKVIAGEGQVIYNGFGKSSPQTLSYEFNNIRFEYAATSFNSADKTKYQIKLEGEDDKWSSWSNDASKDYLDLWEGHYTLYVKARNRNGTVIESALFELDISPPWYRTITAYLIYLVIFVSTILFFRYWRNKRESEQRARFEKEIKKITEQVKDRETKESETLVKEFGSNEQQSLKRLKLQIGTKIWLVPIQDIICLLANGRYVKVVTTSREGLIRTPLKSLISQLDSEKFWQIHRSTVININYLDHVGKADSERLTVAMKGYDEPLQVSKGYSHLFRSIT